MEIILDSNAYNNGIVRRRVGDSIDCSFGRWGGLPHSVTAGAAPRQLVSRSACAGRHAAKLAADY